MRGRVVRQPLVRGRVLSGSVRGRMSSEPFLARARHRVCVELGRFVVDIGGDDRRVVDAIESSLDGGVVWELSGSRAQMRGFSSATHHASPLVRLRLELATAHGGVPAEDLPPSHKAASTFEDVELYGLNGVRILVVGRRSMVRIDRSTGVARGFVAPKHLESPWIIAHRIVYLALIELLRCHGAHYLHAGCVCHGDAGILICGPSGAGKSTLTYALARAGFAFVSDDGVFVEGGDGGLRAIAWPEKIKMGPQSCNFFGELSHLGSVKGKVELAPREIGVRRVVAEAGPEAMRVVSVARPAAILFPVRSAGAVSEIEPLPKHKAFTRILGQCIPSLAPADVAEQMEMIHALVEQSRCYEIRTAQDFDVIPKVVRRTVEGGRS